MSEHNLSRVLFTRWLGVGLLISISAFLLLSAGILDKVFIEPQRAQWVTQIEAAGALQSENVNYLIEALTNPDWYVVSVATQQLQAIWEADKLTTQ